MQQRPPARLVPVADLALVRPRAIVAGMAKRPDHRAEFADISTKRLLKLQDEYRAGRVELVAREPDAEVRARLNAVNGKMLAAIEAELEKRMGGTG
jgi:hypothetical protein